MQESMLACVETSVFGPHNCRAFGFPVSAHRTGMCRGLWQVIRMPAPELIQKTLAGEAFALALSGSYTWTCPESKGKALRDLQLDYARSQFGHPERSGISRYRVYCFSIRASAHGLRHWETAVLARLPSAPARADDLPPIWLRVTPKTGRSFIVITI
jgi:hypothetical protein